MAQGRLHEIACRFSPRIELVAERPGTYALDIRGMNTIFGDATQLATKLRQSVMAAGFLANVATAAVISMSPRVSRGDGWASRLFHRVAMRRPSALCRSVFYRSNRNMPRCSRHGVSAPVANWLRLRKRI